MLQLLYIDGHGRIGCLCKGYNVAKDGFSGQFFQFLEIIIFCIVVAIFDLVHDVEAIFLLPYNC